MFRLFQLFLVYSNTTCTRRLRVRVVIGRVLAHLSLCGVVLFYDHYFVLWFFIVSLSAVHLNGVISSVLVKPLLRPVLYKLVSSRFAWQKFVFLFLCHENKAIN